MPMTWTVELAPGGRAVIVCTQGHFNLTDYVRMVNDILSRDYWKPGMDAYFDHRKASFEGTDFMTIMSAGEQMRSHDKEIGDGRAAILMKHMGDYGLGRMFQNVTDDKISAKLKIFTDEKEARAWLGLDG
ncbi:MAG: hypothetical protein KIS92_16345 [Planctomycetota bacterium]|nr:hypothetical protein [Planctomycetota bacterium]